MRPGRWLPRTSAGTAFSETDFAGTLNLPDVRATTLDLLLMTPTWPAGMRVRIRPAVFFLAAR